MPCDERDLTKASNSPKAGFRSGCMGAPPCVTVREKVGPVADIPNLVVVRSGLACTPCGMAPPGAAATPGIDCGTPGALDGTMPDSVDIPRPLCLTGGGSLAALGVGSPGPLGAAPPNPPEDMNAFIRSFWFLSWFCSRA